MSEFKLKEENDIPDGYEIPNHIDMWYDVHTKSWVLQTKDKYDNQVGDAEYISGKQSALKIKKELDKKILEAQYEKDL